MKAKIPGATAPPAGSWWPWQLRACSRLTESLPGEPKLAAILSELAPGVDLILVEGYKTSNLPKIGVMGPDVPPALPDYPRLVAWVSPTPLATDLPVFPPLHVAEIGRFIQAQLGCP